MNSHDENSTIDTAKPVDDLLNGFRDRWNQNERPAIEDYVSDLSGDECESVLAALIEIEVNILREDGASPLESEYQTRFPQNHSAVNLAWRRLEQQTPPKDWNAPKEGSDTTVLYRTIMPSVASGRYKSMKFHARGGMGEVWLAEDTELGRRVALKRIRKKRQVDDMDRNRFIAEAQISGQLEHPSIVPIHDLGIDDEGRPFYVMKFVHGRTLKGAIEDYHLGKETTSKRNVQRRLLLERFLDVCEAVAYAHSHGVVHRDLKPDNVMLGPFGETLVLDWGLAKVLSQPEMPGLLNHVTLTGSGRTTDTLEGSPLGTPAYIAPEMAEGKLEDVGIRSDVYLLGATLYEILTAQPPRRGSSRSEVVEMARTMPPVPPHEVNKRVPRDLDSVCQKAMARRPEDRYESPQQLAADIRLHLAGEPVSTYREPILKRTMRWCSKHQVMLTRVAATLLVVSLCAAVLGWARSNARGIARAETRESITEWRELVDTSMLHMGVDDGSQPVSYYQLSTGLQGAQKASELAEQKWGSGLENFLAGMTLTDEEIGEREEIRDGLYDLLLTKARIQLESGDLDEVGDALRRASALKDLTPGYHRIDAERLAAEGLAEEHQEAMEKAQAGTMASIDYFLAGEAIRTENGRNRERLEDAIEQFRAALRLDPENYWAQFQLARCLLGLGRAREAIEAFGACIALRPNEPWAYSSRGLAKMLVNDSSGALADLDTALEESPDFIPARLNRGRVYLAAKKYELAVADLTAVLKSQQPLLEAAYYLGQLHYEQQNWREAEVHLQSFEEQHSEFRPAMELLTKVRCLDNRLQEAKKSLDRWLELGTQGGFVNDSPQTRLERGRFWRETASETIEAEFARAANAVVRHQNEWLKTVDQAQLPSEVRDVLNDEGLLRSAVGKARLQRHLLKTDDTFKQRIDDAKGVKKIQSDVLQQALAELIPAWDGLEDSDPLKADVAYEKGLALQKLKRFRESLDTYSAGLAIVPNSLKLLNKRGHLKLGLRQHASAVEDFSKATLSQPQTEAEEVLVPEAHSWLGYQAATTGESGDAFDAAARALALLNTLSPKEKNRHVILHNVACIYGELAKQRGGNQKDLERFALTLVKQALAEAEPFGRTAKQIQDILVEPAFSDTIRDELRQLKLIP